MALLPVYRWLGLEDDLSRREQWMLNVIGLAVTVLGAHAFGIIDLSGVSTTVLRELSTTGQLAVSLLAILAAFAVVHTVSERDLSEPMWVVAAAVGGFFLLDLFYLHPAEFDNVPALFYWAAKPIWVGVPMFVAAWWLAANTEMNRRLVYTIAGIFGVITLQLYYTVIPIPMVGGESVQVGLLGNLTTGLQVHGLALLLALAAIVVGIQGRRYVGGGS